MMTLSASNMGSGARKGGGRISIAHYVVACQGQGNIRTVAMAQLYGPDICSLLNCTGIIWSLLQFIWTRINGINVSDMYVSTTARIG